MMQKEDVQRIVGEVRYVLNQEIERLTTLSMDYDQNAAGGMSPAVGILQKAMSDIVKIAQSHLVEADRTLSALQEIR